MRKIVFFIVTLAAVVASANAQNFEKGDWFLGAGASNLMLGSLFSKTASETALEMTVNGGYFLFDKMAVETQLTFDYEWYDHKCYSNYSFGADLRYYPVGNFFGAVGYAGTVSDNLPLSSYFMVIAGYDWFVSERVFFEPALCYWKRLTKNSLNSISLNLAVGVKF